MKKVLYLVMFCGLIAVGGCSGKKDTSEKITYTEIDCATKDELLNKGAMLIDVRERSEYDQYHLEYAVNYPSTLITNKISDEVVKDAPIILYCVSGTRSRQVAESLVEQGYTNIYDLGSINKCVEQLRD